MAEERAKDFPMLYLTKPIKAMELRSKISVAPPTPDATIQPDQPSYDTGVETADASLSIGLSFETEVT